MGILVNKVQCGFVIVVVVGWVLLGKGFCVFFRLFLIVVLLVVFVCSFKVFGLGVLVLKVMCGEYCVKCGDIFYLIVIWYGWNYKDLVCVNGICLFYVVKVGQVVCFDGCKLIYVVSSCFLFNICVCKLLFLLLLVILCGWQWLMKGLVICCFFSFDKFNKGICIVGILGQLVQVLLVGKVVFVVNNMCGYGNLVIIQYGILYISIYVYNSCLLVKEGQMVGKGQKIVEVGFLDVDWVQLYFEICQNGWLFDLLSLLLLF